MAFLLRHRPDVGQLTLDEEGWAPLPDLCKALSKMMRCEVTIAHIEEVVTQGPVRRFEVSGVVVRATRRDTNPDHGRPCIPPDVLYHATTADHVEVIRSRGELSVGGYRLVFLSSDEQHAWRVAHRLRGGPPAVMYIDALRARRDKVNFYRTRRGGLYRSLPIPARHILNLQPGYGPQLSAGGLPIRRDENGNWSMAMVRVARRRGVTWELAKGKIEVGETPEVTAVREVQEEMGLSCDLEVLRYVGDVRYPFTIPEGEPRLKTVMVYLLEPKGEVTFTPKGDEGIREVEWFDPDAAVRAVTHSSLRPMMHRVREVLRTMD